LAKNEELQKINLELDHFVYSISHDLRAPLLSIKGIMHVLLNNNNLDTQTREFLNLADTSATRLDGTIQEILEYSRNSRLELKLEQVDLKELFMSAYTDLKFSIEEQVDFQINISGENTVQLDRARLNVLIKNIVGNSLKYKSADRNPFVHVDLRNANGWLDVSVRDNGEGISAEHLPHVFEMFYRATTNSVGTGLGLYICKEIVQKLGGRIQVNSVLNQGTEIHFTIPIQ
ncbi:MAG: sensor histidine kinase, partial [Bacteroidota bacterium]